MNLEQLVPPLELCQQIPQGAFADSALVWTRTWCRGEPCVQPREEANENGWTTYAPAPTLAEILETLPKFNKNEVCLAVVPDFPDEGEKRIFGEAWAVGYTDKDSVKDTTPATAALRLWMEVNKEGRDK